MFGAFFGWGAVHVRRFLCMFVWAALSSNAKVWSRPEVLPDSCCACSTRLCTISKPGSSLLSCHQGANAGPYIGKFRIKYDQLRH
eukprot:338890-Amphidinium_carterae.1